MLIKHGKTQVFHGEAVSNTAYLHGDIRRECMTPNGGKKIQEVAAVAEI